MEVAMPMRKNEGAGTKVTVRFQDSISFFLLSPGDTVGDLASRLDRLSEQRGAKPLTIALTFPSAAKPVLH
jgi:hypothetical protein